MAFFGAAATPARADYRIVDFTQAKATKATGTIDPEDGVLVRGAIGPGKAIANTLTFTPRQPTLAVSISWLVGTASARFRLIGVNVDLKNNAGSLVAERGVPGPGGRGGDIGAELRRAGPGSKVQADADGHVGRGRELHDGGGDGAVISHHIIYKRWWRINMKCSNI